MPVNYTTDPGITPEEEIPVTIAVGGVSLTADDEDAKFVQDQPTPFSIFTETVLNNRYYSDPGRFMLGVNSPAGFEGDTVAFVQLRAPTLLWMCDWTTERWDTQPDVPDPAQLADSNWVLLGMTPETRNVAVGPDGISALYRISGTYFYGHRRPNANPFAHVAYGLPPWLEDTFEYGRNHPSIRKSINQLDATTAVAQGDGTYLNVNETQHAQY